MPLEQHVTRLINDIGDSLTLRKVTEGTYDPSTGAVSGQTTADTSVKGMLLNYKDYQFSDSQIQRGDRKIVLRASDAVSPQIGDLVVDGSVQYKIVDVSQIEESGDIVVYVCQGRQ